MDRLRSVCERHRSSTVISLVLHKIIYCQNFTLWRLIHSTIETSVHIRLTEGCEKNLYIVTTCLPISIERVCAVEVWFVLEQMQEVLVSNLLQCQHWLPNY